MNLWVVFICTVMAELFVLRRLRFDWVTIVIVLAGTIMYVDYLSYTTVSERNCDGSAHLEYIQFIAQHRRLPEVYACGACGHPPLYYALAALWSTAIVGWMPFELGLQWLSLLLFLGFVDVSLVILHRCTTRSSIRWLATALVVFWPSSIINSVRVHNDALASLLMLAAMYFIAQWDRQGRPRDFHAAVVASALAMLTKSTGYAVAATLAFFALLRLRSAPPLRGILKPYAMAVLVLGATAFVAVGFRDSRNPTTLCQKVLGHACDGRYVPPVPDRPSRFVLFDVVDFLQRTDTLPIDPERDYFLNRFLKSSLFGVMPLGDELGSERHVALAMAIRVLLLAMGGLSIVGLLGLRGADFGKHRAYLAAGAIMFLFLVAFRVRLPNEFHEDFRHIFPALVPFCLGYAVLADRMGRFSKVLHVAAFALGLAMIASSVAFFARIPWR